MLALTETEKSLETAKEKIRGALESGAALEKFRENIELQGGDAGICDNPEILFDDRIIKVQVRCPEDGFIDEIDTTEIGRAISSIGGGRMRMEDKIDPAVGFACNKKLGDAVREHEVLGTLFCRNETQAALILAKLQMAYKISGERPVRRFELVKEVI
jgi:pyrimidine-nucleoside phosphorylase